MLLFHAVIHVLYNTQNLFISRFFFFTGNIQELRTKPVQRYAQCNETSPSDVLVTVVLRFALTPNCLEICNFSFDYRLHLTLCNILPFLQFLSVPEGSHFMSNLLNQLQSINSLRPVQSSPVQSSPVQSSPVHCYLRFTCYEKTGKEPDRRF